MQSMDSKEQTYVSIDKVVQESTNIQEVRRLEEAVVKQQFNNYHKDDKTSFNVPFDIKVMPGFDMVVDLNWYPNQQEAKKIQENKEPDHQVEVISPN